MRSLAARLAIRAAALVLALLAFARFAYAPWNVDHVIYRVMKQTQRATQAGTTSAVLIARSNIEMLQKIRSAAQLDVNYYLLYAFNERVLGNREHAIDLYTAALARADHRPEIYFERGQTWLELGNVDAAAKDLIHAARFNPTMVDELSGELQERVAKGAGIK